MSEREPGIQEQSHPTRQHLAKAMFHLREAEDWFRTEMPAWPTADRIRTIYEQITADVLNGNVKVPPIAQRLREAEVERDTLRAENERLRDALIAEGHGDEGGNHRGDLLLAEICKGCLALAQETGGDGNGP